MKKKYLILLLLLFTVVTYSQKSIGIDDGSGNGLPTSAPSNEVGITAGELSVSLNGSANYSIPIAVPPGIKDVTPKISLNYNSQSGNGLAGLGWNLSGLSSITRIPSTKFHDNEIDPVDFDESDRFALDGNRLILKSGVYGAVGSTYETENFSNLKISILSGGKISLLNFKVEYPDGSIAFYGYSPGIVSNTLLNYALIYWENPQGLRISYTYLTNNKNNLYIDTIKYGSTGQSTPINEIKFIYKAKTNFEQSYVGGISIVNDKILSQISVKGNSIGYRNYYLTHDKVINYERLIKITEKTGDNTKSYNATSFVYENISSESIRFANSSTIPELTRSRHSPRYNPDATIGDYDGDGNIDFITSEMKLFINVNGDGNNLSSLSNSTINSTTILSRFTVNKLQGNDVSGYKLSNKQGLCTTVNKSDNTGIIFNVYSYQSSTNPLNLEYNREH